MNPTPRRPRFALLPLVLLAWGLALFASVGLNALFSGGRGGGMFGPAGMFGGPSPEARDRALNDGVARALAFARDNNADGADNALSGTVQSLDVSPDAYAAVGRLVTRRGRPELAMRLLAGATANKTLNWDPNVWDALAFAQKEKGDASGAAQSAREADTRANAVLQEAGKTAPGLGPKQLEEVARFLSVGSYFQTAKKDNANAVRAYREAVRIAPEHYLTLNNLGYLLADTGTTKAEWSEALRLTRRATELAPGDPVVADSYGWALYRLGNYANARRVLRRAVDDMPNAPELRLHLAAVYEALHLPEQAQTERTRAARLDPDDAKP